jgi:hypothetical protein
VEGGRYIRCKCRCGGGRLDEVLDHDSVMRKGGFEHQIVIWPWFVVCLFGVDGL